MTEAEQKELGRILWAVANDLRGAMNADDFRDYMLSFLFLRYLSDNYEAAASRELGSDYLQPEENEKRPPLLIWYLANGRDVEEFEELMRHKAHYVIKPEFLWSSIAEMARTQDDGLLKNLETEAQYCQRGDALQADHLPVELPR